MARFLLIRHGMTQGNREGRYSGDRSEPLCAEGIQAAKALAANAAWPPVDTVLSGPALRCRQTAACLFPGRDYGLCPMGEIDFGVFKGKNADELRDDRDYAQWLATRCMGDIPGGDSVAAFRAACCRTFGRIADENTVGTTALVLHGGNIMAILAGLAQPRGDFYDYHLPNCGFFLCRWEEQALVIERRGP